MEQKETDFINGLTNQDLGKVSDETLAKQIKRAGKAIQDDNNRIDIARIASMIGVGCATLMIATGLVAAAAPTAAFGAGLLALNIFGIGINIKRQEAINGLDKILTGLKEEQTFREKLKHVAPHIQRGIEEPSFNSGASPALGFNDNAKPDPTQAAELKTPAVTITAKQSVQR